MSRVAGLAYAVDGANIGVFDSHRCFRRLKVHACEEKYIEWRKKSTLNVGVRRRSSFAARISPMYGRSGQAAGITRPGRVFCGFPSWSEKQGPCPVRGFSFAKTKNRDW